MVETFGTENVDRTKLNECVQEVFDLRPGAILRDLDLRKPIYKKTAAYGHFGRTGAPGEFPWENLDRVDDVKSALGL
jgi:S-adenosylmethionine synthetase